MSRAHTFAGKATTLAGSELKAGDAAPAFTLTAADLSPATLDSVTDTGAHAALLIVVPSLDTGVCSIESKKFNDRFAELNGTTPFVVSMDLPFAQKRWCGAEGAANLKTLSDYKDHSFGEAYGVRVNEFGLLARTIFVIGKDKKIAYAQYLADSKDEPDYDAAVNAAKAAA